jgi:hypothetical protein
MEDFSIEREQWLRSFLELPHGVPDSDTFRRIYERLNPIELSKILKCWLEDAQTKGTVINIDGKTISGNGNHKAYHVVSAWA